MSNSLTYSNTKQVQVKRFFYVAMMITIAAVFLLTPDLAFAAGGLDRAKSGMEKFEEAIVPVLRIGCVIAFILAGAGYMAGFLDKSWFVKAIVGIIIIGSANEIVSLLW